MKRRKRNGRKAKKYEVLFEFLLFGIIIGVTEDLIAVHITTGEQITWTMVGIVILLAIPFAFLGEFIADHVDFIKVYERIIGKRKTEK